MAVDGDDFLTGIGVADIDERLLQRGDQVGIHDLGVLADRDGVVVDGSGDADNVGLLPDAAFAAELGIPALGIVAAGVSVGHQHVHLTGGQTGKGAGVGVGLHGALQIGNALAVVILQPQSGIDIAGGRGCAHDAPVGAVQILPGQFLAVVDLGGQLLTLVGGAGDHQSAVGHGLLVGSLGGLTVVPVLGIVGILAQAVAGSGQDDLCAVIVQHIGTAGDQAHVDGTGLQALAHSLVGRADGDLHVAHLVALLGQLVLQHLLQRLGHGDDLLGLAGGHEGDLQRLDLLGAVGIAAGAVVAGVGLVAAACQQAQRHDQRQKKRNDLFHLFSSIIQWCCSCAPASPAGRTCGTAHERRTIPSPSIAHLVRENFSVLGKK